MMQSTLKDTIAEKLGIGPRDMRVMAGREGRIVCRASTPVGDVVAKASSSQDEFQQEADAMARLKSVGVPVSDVVAVDGGPPSILVASWAEGRTISASSDPEALRRVGAILGRIHRQPAGPPFSGHACIQHWIETWFADVVTWWRSTTHYFAGVDRVCEEWLAEVKPGLSTRPGRLILFDGRPDHFLVDDTGRIRLIDVADLMAGDPAMDLAVLELGAPGVLPHVIEGYAPTPGERDAIAMLVPFYVLLRTLSGAEWQARVQRDDAASERHLALARALIASRARSA